MKRKIILSTILILIITLSLVLIYPKKEKTVLKNQSSKKNNFLSIMIEEQAGTGKYNKINEFPQTGYVLNSNLSKCLNGSKIKYENGSISVIGTKSDRCYVYFDYDALGSICRNQNMAECFIKNYQKDETLYFHNAELEGGAEDDSYRYAGPSNDVKNFVCLDGGVTTDGPCGNNDADLYRIIGLFKNSNNQYEMKLIKYDYATIFQLGGEDVGAYDAIYEGTTTGTTSNYKGNQANLTNIGGYFWTSNSNKINEWVNSDLRNINLNGYYLDTYLKGQKHIDTDKLIKTHTWSLNGRDDSEVTPKVMYDNEMNKVTDSSPRYPTQTKEVQDKIGLMYASDYGYATSPSSTSNWNTILSNTTYKNNNWMYMGLHDWTISRCTANSSNAFNVHNNGGVGNFHVSYINHALGIRPSFYITSDAQIKSGDGSKERPYRIGLE